MTKSCPCVPTIGENCPECYYDPNAPVARREPSLAERLAPYCDCLGSMRCGPCVAVAELRRLEAALTKISAIRDDMVGRQAINWSAHIYPIVAALGEAGFAGLGFEESRKRAVTNDEVTRRLEADNARLREALYRCSLCTKCSQCSETAADALDTPSGDKETGR